MDGMSEDTMGGSILKVEGPENRLNVAGRACIRQRGLQGADVFL